MKGEQGDINVDWIHVWVAELFAERPDVTRMTEAADHIAANLYDKQRTRQIVDALQHGVDDRIDCDTCQEHLPDFLMAQMNLSDADSTFTTPLDPQIVEDVRNHLALCPYCAGGYAQMAEWVLTSETDQIPAAAEQPDFDLGFLRVEDAQQKRAPGTLNIQATMQNALAAGRRWTEDAAGRLFIFFSPNVHGQVASAWGLKSSQPGALLDRTVLGDDEITGWEIEAAAFIDDTDTELCRIEVTLFPTSTMNTNVSNKPITIHYGAVTQTLDTDDAGVVEFEGVPVAQLPHLAIQLSGITDE